MKTRQRKHELVKGGVLVVGVDIGKFKHFAAFRVSGLVVKTLGFENDLAGFEAPEACPGNPCSQGKFCSGRPPICAWFSCRRRLEKYCAKPSSNQSCVGG